jgi:hypothetical protein
VLSSSKFQCAYEIFLFFFTFLSLLFLHKLQGGERREEREKTKKKKRKITLETHRSSDDNTICTIEKYLDETNSMT